MKFYEACEAGKGWDECSQYVASEEAPFDGQFVGAVSGIHTIKVKTMLPMLF